MSYPGVSQIIRESSHIALLRSASQLFAIFLSIVRVPEVFAKVNLVYFPSCFLTLESAMLI